ncbi:MAG TPA: hypothetical protein VJR29_04030 [bacterium]|nr:hypothetical protein [bacterium]
MELQHVNIKIFAENPQAVEQELFTPIFHSWIQEQAAPETLLLDVADYLHVPQGPGIVLIGNEADYSMDDSGGRLGLRYNRKLALGGNNGQRFAQALKAALWACLKLEKDPRMAGKLKFKKDELELFVNDRALAPNLPETQAACSGEIQSFFEKIFPEGFQAAYPKDPRERFGVLLSSAKPFDFEAALQKL